MSPVSGGVTANAGRQAGNADYPPRNPPHCPGNQINLLKWRGKHAASTYSDQEMLSPSHQARLVCWFFFGYTMTTVILTGEAFHLPGGNTM